MKKYNVAILGAGHIAASMAQALNGISDKVCCYAVASRSLERAQAFADKWGFEKAYGSYDELVSDLDVDLVYVATPHSHHFEHANLCINHGKAALVEKAFTANGKQAAQLLEAAEEKGVLLTEAMWTRFMPSRQLVADILDSGVLGEITHMEAEFSYPLMHKERVVQPALAGGALLDIGIYALNFASMYFGDDIVDVQTTCEKYETGVDATSETVFTYADGKKAVLRSSFVTHQFNEGVIYGTCGSLWVKDLNNFSAIERRDLDGNVVETYPIPAQINGYEYEVLAAIDALSRGAKECGEMPHAQTLTLMGQMDALREMWGVKYPFE